LTTQEYSALLLFFFSFSFPKGSISSNTGMCLYIYFTMGLDKVCPSVQVWETFISALTLAIIIIKQRKCNQLLAK
jgi:hypothetical protein